MNDLISRQAILKHIEKIRQDALMMDDTRKASIIMNGMHLCEEAVRNQPPAKPERKKGKWTTEEVAELLFNVFGDDCACDFNDIDEWLPERCKYTEIADECPNPKEKHGCWMQFLLQGGANMWREE